MSLNRRVFLLATAAAPLYPASPLVTFTAEEARLIEALCAQIIPADDAPGAKEAGVLYYLDQQLTGPLKRFVPAYKSGLLQWPKDFLDLPAAQQTAKLEEIEARGPLAGFFAMLVDHTMQGFYGSPQHGGNRDEASWTMLGINQVMGGHSH